jgi:clan AA aspartic protease
MRFRFDTSFDPPAPVLPVHFDRPIDGGSGVLMRMLIDTGADCTLIPARVVRALRLPLVDRTEVLGVGGTSHAAPVHAATVRIGTSSLLTRVVAFGNEALLGRNVLNRLFLELDGVAQTCSVLPRRKRARR